MNTDRKSDEVAELRTGEVDAVSGASPGHVVLGFGLLYAGYRANQHIRQQNA
jgi:hypothetical protein